MHKYTVLILLHMRLHTLSHNHGEHMFIVYVRRYSRYTHTHTHTHTHTFTRERTDEAVGLILQVFLLASSPLN